MLQQLRHDVWRRAKLLEKLRAPLQKAITSSDREENKMTDTDISSPSTTAMEESLKTANGEAADAAPAADFNPFNPSDLDARYAAMAHMRATCPVAPLGESSWYAATHEGVLTGLKNVDKFVGSFIDTSKLPEDEVMISAIPEPRHGKIRRVINGVMAPHRTMHAEGFIRDLAQKLLDDALASPNSDGTASFDLIDEYVDPIPSTVIAHVLGCPVEDFNNFRRWSDELLENQNIQLDNPSSPVTMSSTHPEFAAYIQHQIDIRRAAPEPPDDLIGRFIAADIDGQP